MAGNLKNRADQGDMRDFVDRIERCNKDKASAHGVYMKRCGEIQNDINAILDEAKDAGLTKKSVKAVIKVREHEAKAKALREDLEDDDAALFDDIREALGDFADSPLGAAAVERDGAAQDDTTAAIVGAVEADEEREKIAAQKVADAEAFDQPENVTSLDPKKARANRSKAAATA